MIITIEQPELPFTAPFPAQEPARQPLITIPEIRVLTRIISTISWINFIIGLPGAVLFPIMHNLSAVATGWLAIACFLLLRLITGQMARTKSWNEICAIAVCGIYFPAFIVYISGTTLLEVIIYGN